MDVNAHVEAKARAAKEAARALLINAGVEVGAA